MKYIKVVFESVEYWIEIRDDNYAQRQIIVGEAKANLVSSRTDCLAEGIVNEFDLGGIIEVISKEDFNKKWIDSMKRYEKDWNDLKNKIPIGTKLEGVYRYTYPQGDIFQIDKGFGILQCNDNGGIVANCPIGSKVKLVVKGYDELNMWLILSKFTF